MIDILTVFVSVM